MNQTGSWTKCVVSTVLLVGCGGPDRARDSGAEPAVMAAMDGGAVSVDAGLTAPDAGTSAPDAGARKIGTVALVQQRVVIPGLEPLFAGAASAFFFDQPVPCSVTRVDGCEVTECAVGAGFDAGTPQRAGTLSFDGLDLDGGLQVGFSNGYSAPLQRQVFSFGSPVTVRASGADVPGFTATVTAPEGTLLTTPVCQSSNCGAVSRSQPLEVTWAAPTFGTAIVELSSGSTQLRCSTSAATRRAVVPASLLARLPAGQGVLTVGGASTTTLAAGPWDVTFTVRDTVFGLIDLQP